MGSAFQVVDEDGAPYPDLVTEQAGMGELRLEAVVGSNVLPGMGLTRVHEEPGRVGTSFGRFTEQRTLCRAVRSGEGAELQYDIPPRPHVGELQRSVIEREGGEVRSRFAGVQMIGKGRELGRLLPRLDILVESGIVVAVCGPFPSTIRAQRPSNRLSGSKCRPCDCCSLKRPSGR